MSFQVKTWGRGPLGGIERLKDAAGRPPRFATREEAEGLAEQQKRRGLRCEIEGVLNEVTATWVKPSETWPSGGIIWKVLPGVEARLVEAGVEIERPQLQGSLVEDETRRLRKALGRIGEIASVYAVSGEPRGLLRTIATIVKETIPVEGTEAWQGLSEELREQQKLEEKAELWDQVVELVNQADA